MTQSLNQVSNSKYKKKTVKFKLKTYLGGGPGMHFVHGIDCRAQECSLRVTVFIAFTKFTMSIKFAILMKCVLNSLQNSCCKP